jgi:hypothetical protein
LTLALAAMAQTNTNGPPIVSGPITDVIEFLGTGSNWIVAPYGIYDDGTKEWGAGIGIGYKLNDFVVPTMRFDWLNEDITLINGSVQLQVPILLGGKVKAIPFVFAGGGTPLSGSDDEGSLIGIFGSGLTLGITDHLFIIGDWETWGGFQGYQYRFGAGIKF